LMSFLTACRLSASRHGREGYESMDNVHIPPDFVVERVRRSLKAS
jgi:hypothetical protein